MKTVEQHLPHLNFQVHGCAILCTNENTDFFQICPKGNNYYSYRGAHSFGKV